VKLVFGEKEEAIDGMVRVVETRLELKGAEEGNEFELARFNLNPGAALRCDYDSFSDLRTQENTLDITRAPYAGIGARTYHPRVMSEFARALLDGSNEQIDVAFGIMCLNSDIVHKSAIQWYIDKKNSTSYQDYTLSKLYDKLVDALPWKSLKGRAERRRWRGPDIV
jgi:hypothetical protein